VNSAELGWFDAMYSRFPGDKEEGNVVVGGLLTSAWMQLQYSKLRGSRKTCNIRFRRSALLLAF
jgi:hypothetical protein